MAIDLEKEMTGLTKEWWEGADAMRQFLLDQMATAKRNYENFSVNRCARDLADNSADTTSERFIAASKRYASAKEVLAYMEMDYDKLARFVGREDFVTFAKKKKG